LPVTKPILWCGIATLAGAAAGILGFLISFLHPLYSNSLLLDFRLGALAEVLPLSRYITVLNGLGSAQVLLTAAGAVGLFLLIHHRSGRARVAAAGTVLVLLAATLLTSQGFYALGRGDSVSPAPGSVTALFNASEVVRVAGLLLLGAGAVLARSVPLWGGLVLFMISFLESDVVYLLLLLQPVTEESAGYSPLTAGVLELVPPAISLAWASIAYLLISAARNTKEAPAETTPPEPG
jgi:hypothetical protein